MLIVLDLIRTSRNSALSELKFEVPKVKVSLHSIYIILTALKARAITLGTLAHFRHFKLN